MKQNPDPRIYTAACRLSYLLLHISQAQFIHCIVQYQGVGGDSLIVDATHVARQLQLISPDYYRILTETPVDWFDIGTDETGEYYKVLRLPMIW